MKKYTQHTFAVHYSNGSTFGHDALDEADAHRGAKEAMASGRACSATVFGWDETGDFDEIQHYVD